MSLRELADEEINISRGILEYVQAKTSENGSCIEECNISGINTTLWREPWHDEQEELDGDVESDDDVPCSEL